MPRRIAQERVPTASNVRSRDVTWASQHTPLIPFRVFRGAAQSLGPRSAIFDLSLDPRLARANYNQ